MYFKDYQSKYKNSITWYCHKDKCISCKFSYGEMDFEGYNNLRCKRPTFSCNYEELDKIELRKVVDRKLISGNGYNGQTKYQVFVEEG